MGRPAVFGAADASERASEMFLRTGAFFSSILSEFLKNLVALQNRVNYQPYYGIKEIERKYDAAKILDFDHRWLAPILEFDGKKTDDDQKTINLFAAYVKYLQAFAFNLINEYDERRGRGAGVLSSINNNRTSKIVPPSPVYTYL